MDLAEELGDHWARVVGFEKSFEAFEDSSRATRLYLHYDEPV